MEVNFKGTMFNDGEAKIASINLREPTDKDSGPLSVKTSFINYLNHDVVVVMRNGLRHTVTFTPQQHRKTFIIRNEYFIAVNAFNDIKRILAQADDHDFKDLHVLKQAFYQALENNPYAPIRIFIDTEISQEKLKAHKGSIYVSNQDVIISTSSLEAACPHPFNSVTVNVQKFEELTSNQSGISFFLEIIDNDDQISERFFFIAKNVIKVKPIKDPDRENGVYFCSVTKVMNNDIEVEKVHFSISDAEEKLGLFKTREEAISAGDVQALRQEELSKLTHALAEKKIELQTIQADHSQKENEAKGRLLELDRQLKELERSNKELEARAGREKAELERKLQEEKAFYERRKYAMEDHYSTRSYERKDTSEFWKAMPALIVAGVGIATLILK